MSLLSGTQQLERTLMEATMLSGHETVVQMITSCCVLMEDVLRSMRGQTVTWEKYLQMPSLLHVRVSYAGILCKNTLICRAVCAIKAQLNENELLPRSEIP